MPSPQDSHAPAGADLGESLAEQVRAAARAREPLAIRGGGSKAFYGRPGPGRPLAVAGHRGVVDYAPTELVVTARAGTPLAELEDLLAAQGQMLAFEPPYFGPGATLGGTVACGLSGPRRPYAGAVRDFVLGVRCVNGRGEVLRFGGQVMKNVAGYDLARLMAGALGTLAVLLEVSLKVLPRPALEHTRALELSGAEAISTLNAWAGRPLPLSAACHDGERLYVRLSGSAEAVAAAERRTGGEPLLQAQDFWRALREHQHPFFAGDGPLWRLSLAPATPPLDLPGREWLDWGGAQRWLRTGAPAAQIRAAAHQAGGHAIVFRGAAPGAEVFQPLTPPLLALHRRLKQAFDPEGILNPQRLYPEGP